MERETVSNNNKHDKQAEIEAYFLSDKPLEMQNDYVMGLSELPQEYRHALECGYPSGWKCLDKILLGVRTGELTVITADTGAGKTTFAINLCINLALQGVKVYINSWEMKPQTILRKIASLILRKPMKLSEFSEEDNRQFNEWCAHHQVYINPNTIGTDLHKFTKELIYITRMGVKIVLIDHLDYLIRPGYMQSQVDAIKCTVKRLHELAEAFNLHIILICHPKQSSAATDEVGMHSIKGSSDIKQYADNVITLHRCSRSDKTSDPNKIKIAVQKNRLMGIEASTFLYYQHLWDGYAEYNDNL